MPIRRVSVALLLLASPALSWAQADNCRSDLLTAMPVRPTLLSPVAVELASATTQLGGANGVLSQSFDEALSVDSVLLRIRQDGCRAMARARAPSGMVSSTDPAAYKPRTQYDNAPWRFDMTQNGKRMTADEFDAWMKSRGVRVVGRKDAAPAAAAPAATDTPPPSN